jgi:hypothetical protein
MSNESNYNLYKASLMLAIGGLLFWVVMPKKDKKTTGTTPTKSFDNTPTPSIENADIVANAYSSALSANEPASRLTELNKELMKEFGMRCYMNEDNKLVVCDSSGTIIVTK